MTVVVASGKGGTGKTTVSVGLTQSAGGRVVLLDTDVEAPNAHLFLTPDLPPPPAAADHDAAAADAGDAGSEEFTVLVPAIDLDRCTGCGACSSFCAFGALAVIKGRPLLFPDLCHACGGCALVCPEKAITQRPRRIGSITTFDAGSIHHVFGELDIGETLSAPLIRQVKDAATGNALTIIDAPPGTTCPVVESIRGADVGILVTENTPFGLHDLELAAQVFGGLGVPAGVVINRSGIGFDDESQLALLCERHGLRTLARIPYSESIARGYAVGRSILESDPAVAGIFTQLLVDLAILASEAQA